MRKDRDHPAGFAPEYWTGGAELGWCMLLASEDEGGGSVSGRGMADLALIAYEFGKHAAPGPLVDCNVVVAALSGQAGDLQQQALGEVLMRLGDRLGLPGSRALAAGGRGQRDDPPRWR